VAGNRPISDWRIAGAPITLEAQTGPITCPNKVLAAEYRTALPDERLIAAEVERTRQLLEDRNATRRPARK